MFKKPHIKDCSFLIFHGNINQSYRGKMFFSGAPFERPAPLERPLDSVNLNIDVLISTPDERPRLLKGYFFQVKGVILQKGIHCTIFLEFCFLKILLLS